MTTFATIDPAAATYALHASEADARRASAPLTVTQEADLEALTGSQAVALFAATAAPLGIDPVKRFASKGAAARRIWRRCCGGIWLAATTDEGTGGCP